MENMVRVPKTVTAELELFNKPPVNISMELGVFQHHFPRRYHCARSAHRFLLASLARRLHRLGTYHAPAATGRARAGYQCHAPRRAKGGPRPEPVTLALSAGRLQVERPTSHTVAQHASLKGVPGDAMLALF